MKAPQIPFAADKKAAARLDMKPAEFRELAEPKKCPVVFPQTEQR